MLKDPETNERKTIFQGKWMESKHREDELCQIRFARRDTGSNREPKRLPTIVKIKGLLEIDHDYFALLLK